MKKKATSLLLVLIMLISMIVPLAAPAGAAELPDMTGKLVILHTNDTHGHDRYVENGSLGTAAVLSAKEAYEKAGADVLLLHAGDSIQGTPLVNLSKGENAIEFMNAAKYDAMAVGNHEFDYGLENLLELEKKADFPILSANITNKADGKNTFETNKVFTTKSGKKVGVFGLTTPEAMTTSHPTSVSALNFAAEDNLYSVANAQIAALKADGCDYIVALGHLGTESQAAPNRSIDVINNTTGIDLFIDGHSHTTYETGFKVKNTTIVSAGDHLNAIGRVIFDGKTPTASLIKTTEFGKDATVDKLINDKYDEIQAEYSKVFAKTEVNLNGTRTGGDAYGADGKVIASFPEGEGNRVSETNLGDFAADAQLYAAKKSSGKTVDVSIVNGGNIRETIVKGNITKNDLVTVFPYSNTIAVVDIKGAVLLEILEAACYATPSAVGAFPQVSGISFTIDCSTPYEKGDKYPNSTFYAPKEAGSRIKNVKVGGTALDPDATYTLTTNDFIVAGGDTYYALKAPFEDNGIDTGYLLEDCMIDYLQDVCNGVVGTEYEEPHGRIEVINLPKQTPEDFDDVAFSSWYYTPVSYVLGNGMMNGYGTGSFKPLNQVSRAQFYEVLYNMEGRPEVGEEEVFDDVKNGHWYFEAVAWAEDAGLTDGVGNDLFAPLRAITRQEIGKAFADYLDYKDVSAEPADLDEFGDADLVSSWAVDGLGVCVELGVLNGNDKGNLNPRGNTRRCELAQMLYNYSKIEEAVATAVR